MQETPNVLLRLVAVPGWIHSALTRAKRSLSDLGNYGALRQVLSVDDVAQWFYVNNSVQLDRQPIAQYLSDSTFRSISPDERREIQNSVVPLSYSEEIASSVTTRLKSDKPGWQTAGNPDRGYEFVLMDNTIYVILHEGFLTTCEDQQKRLSFVKAYLEKCYSMTSIADVSGMGIFRSYLSHLAGAN